jgi:GTP-binding protein
VGRATLPTNEKLVALLATANMPTFTGTAVSVRWPTPPDWLFFTDENELERSVKKQIEVATREADVLLLVVDGKAPVDALDRSVLLTFRKIKKPVVVAVNKLDSPRNTEANAAPFYKLGIKHVFPVSSVTGRGIGDLLDHLVSVLPETKPETKSSPLAPAKESIAVAIVGKPNVGKSSVFNKILNEERVVVSNVPGTTRTAIDSELKIGDTNFTFIDTAGLKKKAHRQDRPDVYSGFQTYKSIRRSDVCLFLLDANEPVSSQDKAIAEEVVNQEKGCIVLVNKMDLYDARPKHGSVENDRATLQAYVSRHFPFLWMCPVYFVSGLTGEGLSEALKQIKPIYEARHKTVTPEALQKLLTKWMKLNPPKRLKDQKLPKILGLTQIDTNPPKFELLVNHTPAVTENFRQTIQNAIVKDLGFWGTPIKVHKVKKI